MKLRLFVFYALLLPVIVFSLADTAWSACTGADMSGGSYCIYQSGFGVVGGSLDGATNDITASNMYPVQQRSTDSDLAFWYAKANNDYDEGYNFRQSLLLIDLNFDPANPPADPTPQQRMILNPKLNYETAGLLTNIAELEDSLTTARDTFAYDHFVNYQPADGSLPKTHLLNTLKLMANIYLMIGDEFLIDALEFRFSSTTLGMDQKINEQIALLENAIIYYQKALNTFVYGFSPAIGTNIYISDYFDDTIFELFHLSAERLSMGMREKSSKQLAKLISPDPLDTANARKTSGNTLKNVYTSTYLVSAVTAQKTGTDFISYGGDRLVNALNTLRNQGNIYRGNLNPLGYDDRYIPMQSFSTLYDTANQMKNTAVSSQSTLANTRRDFDADAEKMKAAIDELTTNSGGYKYQLANLTGISVYDNDFINKVAVAGDDLYDCAFEAPDFSICMQNKTTGVLGSKYNQIREAELNVQRALKKKQNLLEMVELENQKHNEMLEIENSYNTTYRDTLKNYLEDMKNARTIEKITTKTKGKKKEKQTVTSYYVKNPSLNLEVTKEIALQEALKDYRIAQMNLTDGITIKNYLNNIAETEIEIGLAIQAKNSAIDDFDNAMKEKDNVLSLYKKSLEQLQYSIALIKERITEVRILRCQAAIDLSRNLTNAVHYAYLATKALEYQYMKPIINLTVLNETLNIHDLYKVQTTEDLTNFLNKLNAYNACPWGAIARTTVSLSLAKDILGLTDKYLNPTNTLSPSEVIKLRTQRLQAYLSSRINTFDNSLTFDFSTSLSDSYISKFNKYNMKIWYGTALSPCDPVPAKGVSVKFVTTQTQSILPYINLTQRGHSTYLNQSREILEYVPVGEYLNMLSANVGGSLATTGRFVGYVNTSPDNDSLWDPSFKGRSVASSDWSMQVTDIGDYLIDWSKVTDIVIYLDTIASTLQ